MVFVLDKKYRNYIENIDFSDMSVAPIFSNNTEESFSITVDDNDVLNFEDSITYEIVSNGMDNQDTVNDLGIILYTIYDLIIEQIP